MSQRFFSRKSAMFLSGAFSVVSCFYHVVTGAQSPVTFLFSAVVCLICYGVYLHNKVAEVGFAIVSIYVIVMGVLAVYMAFRCATRNEGEMRYLRPDLYAVGILRAIFHSVLLIVHFIREKRK